METLNENDEKPRVYPNNVQRTMYDIRIADIGKRINRLHNQNEKLSKMIQETEQNIFLKDIQSSDEIAQLNRNLDTELNKIVNSQNAINIINDHRQNEIEVHDDKVNSMKKIYEVTRLKFMSKIKILRATINALEDFKVKEPVLTLKLEAGENLMKEKQENLEKKLNRLDVKFKIDREKLILDLRNKLFELSKVWESDSKKRQGLFVRKLFNENVALHYELNQFNMEKYDEEDHLSVIKNIEFRNKNTEHDINKSLVAIEVQKKLINEFMKRLDITENRRGIFPPLSDDILANYDSHIEKLRSKIMDCERKMGELMVILNKKNKVIEIIRSSKIQSNLKIQKYIKQLYDVKYAIASALQVVDTDSKISSITKTQLIVHLHNLINKKSI